MSLTLSKSKNDSDSKYIQTIFPKFFNKDRFPKVKKQADEGSVEIYIVKKGGRRVGFVIWHETSDDWIYIDFIAATGYGDELISKLHDIWMKHGYKGVNLDTFIYEGELPRQASVRRMNYFHRAMYDIDVIDYPAPGHVMFHMTHKFKSKKTIPGNKDDRAKEHRGGHDRNEDDRGHRISNFPKGY